jgi:hypothetical protein
MPRIVTLEGTMLDTSQSPAIITRLTTAGTPARALIATVASTFADLSPAELSQAKQVAQAEQRAARRH